MQRSKKEKVKFNHEIMVITYVFIAVFLLMIGYLVYFTIFQSNEVINNSYNKRQDLLEKRVLRGSILADDGTVLAYSEENPDGTQTRIYPYGALFAHSVGFNNYGKLGLESIENFTMLRSNANIGKRISNDIKIIKNPGDSLQTSLNIPMQKAAYDALGNQKGAVIVLNVKTGAVMTMVSKPDFDPNLIPQNWDLIRYDTVNSPLLNRTTQGLYPPGSTFKIVTALEYLREYKDVEDYVFTCDSSYSRDNSTIRCFHGQSHGVVDFTKSFAKSCNSSFANITMSLNKKAFQSTCKDLLFNNAYDFPYTCKKSYVSLKDISDTDELLQTGIGQGETLMTPVHMAMITSAIANNGVLMTPYIVDSVVNDEGIAIDSVKISEMKRLLSEDEAQKLKELMREVVISGTGTRIRDVNGYTAAGKTGSAEYLNDSKESHAWFTAFAPCEDPELAIAVVVEGAGSGGEVAVPIARKVFDAYFTNR